MTCHDARELFSARADDALSAAEQAELQAHLATCAECQREWARFEQTVTLLRGIAPAHAPAGFVDRVVAARPRPWYTRLARGLFVPWPVKLPLEAAAILMVAGLAILVFQQSPELRFASHLNEAPPPVALPPVPAKESPAPLPQTEQPAQTELSFRPQELVRSKGRSATEQAPAAEPQRDVAPSVPDERAKKTEATSAVTRKEAELSSERATGNTLGTGAPAPAPATAPPSPATTPPMPPSSPSATAITPSGPTAARAAPPRSAVESTAKQATPERRAALGISPSDSGLDARLAVKDRAGAEATVRDLVAHAGGRVVSRPDSSQGAGIVRPPADASAPPVLFLIVPADRWDEVRRGLEALGSLRVAGEKAENADQVLITLRLEH